MKITDYAPRAAPFDTYLVGSGLVGIEVGVDVGAHAEALLTYCPIRMLRLVDPWPNPWCRGYCEGRLARFRGRFDILAGKSHGVAKALAGQAFDFIYIDQEHDAEAVEGDLRLWFPLLKPGGVFGYRNYVQGRGKPLDVAVESFLRTWPDTLSVKFEMGEVVMLKC